MGKKVSMKIFDPAGNQIGVWENATFKSFTKKLNSGLGNCVIELAEKFDWEDATLKENNEVQIYVSDGDTTSNDNGEVKIYSGYISEYRPYVDGVKEGIEVTVLGYHTKFSQDLYKNGTTVLITESAVDVGVIMKNILDRYQAETENSRIYYSDYSVVDTGTNGSYSFVWSYYMEAINITKSMAPSDYFWYVDENNVFYFKDRPSEATHEFIFGKHFKSIFIRHSMEKIKNAFLLKSSTATVFKMYEDAESISLYGRRVEKRTDNTIQNSATADLIGANFIANNKDPEIYVEIEILDNNESSFGYDIESINPGDTCLFRGFEAEISDVLGDNMLITSVTYILDKVKVIVQPNKSGLINQVQTNTQQIQILNKGTSPDAIYTT